MQISREIGQNSKEIHIFKNGLETRINYVSLEKFTETLFKPKLNSQNI
jgi:hypothetical protein